MSASFESGRDAYWHATQSELKSIRKRGDILTLGGAVALLAFVAFYRDRTEEIAAWLVIVTVLLAVVGTSFWIVAARKRRVAIAHGLVCPRCQYHPHDTEIDEVASSRTCPHCEESLDG
ncbi:MAG TPA: hypothetical protein VMF52_11665 [Steroidobacteraceae bacterium]|nr:hypothetical protein [Steroidobacteraceae bacterium]